MSRISDNAAGLHASAKTLLASGRAEAANSSIDAARLAQNQAYLEGYLIELDRKVELLGNRIDRLVDAISGEVKL